MSPGRRIALAGLWISAQEGSHRARTGGGPKLTGALGENLRMMLVLAAVAAVDGYSLQRNRPPFPARTGQYD